MKKLVILLAIAAPVTPVASFFGFDEFTDCDEENEYPYVDDERY